MNNKSIEMTKQNLINLAIKEYLNTQENLRSLTKVGEKMIKIENGIAQKKLANDR